MSGVSGTSTPASTRLATSPPALEPTTVSTVGPMLSVWIAPLFVVLCGVAAPAVVRGSLRRRVTEPGFEARTTDKRTAAGYQSLVAQFRAEVAGMNVRSDLACIFPGNQDPLHELVEPKLLRAGNLDRVVQRCPQHDVRQCFHNIIRKDRLDECRRDTNRLPVAAGVGYSAHEFEELRGPEDRVRNPRRLDQVLLGHLCAEVAALLQSISADDRQRDMKPYSSCHLGGQEIAPGCLEELHDGRVFEGRRVRDVYDDLSVGESLRQSLPGQGVHA